MDALVQGLLKGVTAKGFEDCFKAKVRARMSPFWQNRTLGFFACDSSLSMQGQLVLTLYRCTVVELSASSQEHTHTPCWLLASVHWMQLHVAW